MASSYALHYREARMAVLVILVDMLGLGDLKILDDWNIGCFI